jgi:hypothetical protein
VPERLLFLFFWDLNNQQIICFNTSFSSFQFFVSDVLERLFVFNMGKSFYWLVLVSFMFLLPFIID